MENAATIPVRPAGYTDGGLHIDPTMTVPVLSSLEARVLGVLVEKQRTVPDTYPLTLNALVAGCNQKTSRDPVMSVTDAEVQAALDTLRANAWIVETSGGRVMRYAHNVERVLAIPAQSVAIIAALLLRGPQTAAELRVNCERMHAFADASAVEGFLHELAERPAGALVTELPRAPGTRETRWAQRLADAPVISPQVVLAAPPQVAPRAIADEHRDSESRHDDIAELRSEVADLRRDLDRLTLAVAELRAAIAPASPESQ